MNGSLCSACKAYVHALRFTSSLTKHFVWTGSLAGKGNMMKIKFMSSISYTVDQLSTMDFSIPDLCEATFFPNGQRGDGQPTLVTAWSSFDYIFYPDETGSGTVWVYDGAENGFLAQELIPPFGTVEILSVEGTYGKWEGAEALKEYQKLKRSWENFWGKIYSPLEGTVFKNSSGWKRTAFCAEMWQVAKKFGFNQTVLPEGLYAAMQQVNTTGLGSRDEARVQMQRLLNK